MQLHQQDPSKGYDAQAIHASERSRARSLLELLTEANADIRTGVDPQLLEQERRLQNQLDAIEKRRVQLFSGNYSQQQQEAIELERETRLSQYRDIQAQIRATSPGYAALTQPQPLTLAEIQQQVLDDQTLLLQYSLGEERSYLWAVTKDSLTSYELPSRREISAAAKHFRNLINHRIISLDPKEVTKAAVPLSQLILAPIFVGEQALAPLGQKRLLIVGDGILQYVPFAALPIPTISPEGKQPREYRPLIVEQEIVNLPSSSTLGILREQLSQRQAAPQQLAILADPVFSADDRRVNSQTTAPQKEQTSDLSQLALKRSARQLDVGNWTRLPGTRQEAEAIMALVPESMRIQVFDFEANLAAATDPELNQYRIVHFATHGLLNSQSPELSGLVLSLVNEQGNSINGFLRLHEIFNLDLGADLVVLSACETGLGKEVKGEGLVGLTRGFMYAGAPRVLVSLWNVDDAATAELISRFYRNLLEKGLSATEALRATQIEMIEETQWKAPYFWAAFVLQGEWED